MEKCLHCRCDSTQLTEHSRFHKRDYFYTKKCAYYLDKKTNLEWFNSSHYSMTWNDAIEFCANLPGGWRLPTIKELFTLVDFNKREPATILPEITPEAYWSSTPLIGGIGKEQVPNAWYIYFNCGSVLFSNIASVYNVRPVRGSLK